MKRGPKISNIPAESAMIPHGDDEKEKDRFNLVKTSLKKITYMCNRIEKNLQSDFHKSILISHKIQLLMIEVNKGTYFFTDPEPLLKNLERVDWEKLYLDLTDGYDARLKEDLSVLKMISEEVEFERDAENNDRENLLKKEMKKMIQEKNLLPCMPLTKWHKDPFPPREYIKIENYVPTESLVENEKIRVTNQLSTELNGFLGPAYNYDDCGLTEAWMVSFRDRSFIAPSADEIIRTQIESLMDIMLGQVQDKVCNDLHVLDALPLNYSDKIKEVPVWGIDSSTRRMIEIAIQDDLSANITTYTPTNVTIGGSDEAISYFIEKKLLPAINAQKPQEAHLMSHALHYLINLENQSSSSKSSSIVTLNQAQAVLKGIQRYGAEYYRIHPKGTGVICCDPKGIPPHVLITEYLGEMYPPYRWCEKLDVIDQAQKKFQLKPALPDFYNILLERPRRDPAGYGLLFVDASEKANLGSSCSHSCNSNCTSNVVARNGQLCIALTSNRFISYGEELTMDYYSVTSSEVEWRAAVCLCGTTKCRGHFLYYATQEELQQVLEQNCGPLWRYASLLRACSSIPLTTEDTNILERHGLRSVALGDDPQLWMKKFAADNLRFIEFERTALPCALLRAKGCDKSSYSYLTADLDARSIMEQRIQSLVCAFSMVSRVHQEVSGLSSPEQQQTNIDGDNTISFITTSCQPSNPLRHLTSAEAVDRVWTLLLLIPDAIRVHLLIYTAKSTAILSQEDKDVINAAVNELEVLLQCRPTGVTSLKTSILLFRAVIVSIQHLASPNARLRLLADVLLLWANTTNFSVAQKYTSFSSQPVTVVARELGSVVSKSLIHGAPVSNMVATKASRKQSTAAAAVVVAAVNKDKYVLTSSESQVILVSEVPPVGDDDDATMPGGVEGDSATETTGEDGSDSACSLVDAAILFLSPPSPECSSTTTLVSAMEADIIPLSIAMNTTMTSTLTSTMACTTAATTVATSASSSTGDAVFKANEPVYTNTKVYGPFFSFWQLMGWFNAGSDKQEAPPDLFGCVVLPEPEACFGRSESEYKEDRRKLLIQVLSDEKKQMLAWPPALQECFSTESLKKQANHDIDHLFGSPMLDVSLGLVDAVHRVRKEILGGDSKLADKYLKEEDHTQFDSILPPELPTAWVQCEGCKKWRRVPWHVDANSLPDIWTCNMNTWDSETANCTVPQDTYDPDRENTLNYEVTEGIKKEDFEIGSWRDVFCVRNRVYYEAQIKQVKVSKKFYNKISLLFHFKGWGAKFDEWLDAESDRIQPHNMYTDPQGDPMIGAKSAMDYVRESSKKTSSQEVLKDHNVSNNKKRKSSVSKVEGKKRGRPAGDKKVDTRTTL